MHGSEEIWKEAPACLSVKWRELSGTPVRRVNKVHLFIPSSFVRCQRLKTGLLGKRKKHGTLISALPLSHCLFVFHTHMSTQTNTQADKERKRCKICSKKKQCHNANTVYSRIEIILLSEGCRASCLMVLVLCLLSVCVQKRKYATFKQYFTD